MARRPIEPLLWLLFSAGGMASAMLVPVLLVLFGFAFPLGWTAPPQHAHLVAVLGHPVVRVGLFGLCTLSLFHWAHRFRYTLYDGLKLKQASTLIIVACYGGALFGTVVAAVVLLMA